MVFAKQLAALPDFQVLQAKYWAVVAALDHLGIGICISDARGYIVVANTEADRVFSLHDNLARTKDDRIVCSRESDTAAIYNAIQAAAYTTVGLKACDEGIFAIERRPPARPFLVEVGPLWDELRAIHAAFAGAIVSIIDPDNPRPFSTENVAKLYGLTAAEEKICRLLVDGLTNEHIANARDVSIDTVKTQVKSIYRKLGVTGRADLVKEVLTVNPPIN